MIRTRLYSVLLMSALFASTGFAQTIASDDFESAKITDNSIAGGSGFEGDWSLIGKGKTDVSIVEKSLAYESGDVKVSGGSKALQYVASDNGIAIIATRILPTQTDTTYLSFLVEPSNSQDTNDFFQIGFDAGQSTAPNISILLQGKFYPRSNTTPGTAPSLNAVKQGETYLVVIKAQRVDDPKNFDQVTIFVNPSSLDESANKSVEQKRNSAIGHIKRLIIRKAFMEEGDTFTLDQIRIGKTFESVVK
jgi:hypothetical protein